MHSIKLLVAIVALSSIGISSASNRKLHRRRNTHHNKEKKNSNNVKKANEKAVMDEEDVKFWTRMVGGRDLQERGKETTLPEGSMQLRPPSNNNPRPRPTPRPTPRVPVPTTPEPTRRPTRRPIASPTPPTAPTFRCPDANFVGCTAPEPTNPVDECTTVGQLCPNGIEHCCKDACPRNYCTAKEGPRKK